MRHLVIQIKDKFMIKMQLKQLRMVILCLLVDLMGMFGQKQQKQTPKMQPTQKALEVTL